MQHGETALTQGTFSGSEQLVHEQVSSAGHFYLGMIFVQIKQWPNRMEAAVYHHQSNVKSFYIPGTYECSQR